MYDGLLIAGALAMLASIALHISMKMDTWSFAPFIELQSGSIPKLNISSSTNLTTTIGIDLTFGSELCNYETIFYKGINATISYKDDRALANVSMQPFGLGKNELKTIHIKQDIKERKELNLSLKMEVDLTYVTKSIFLWGWDGTNMGASFFCWDLSFKFSDQSGIGALNLDHGYHYYESLHLYVRHHYYSKNC
ncbi:hypothetical protein COLO4_29501 [Corchorus olitorius]|uniref:Uncharacterized protein n=1 Tax=Corchorus olitorius TaxID=93759 RepID=A0A1R3HEC9_9ROSI|nr:hypothetical protein COLO4_29501 [Corchorus olitorius]